MLTVLSVENIPTGAGHDVWEVNVEEEYHEEVLVGLCGVCVVLVGLRRHGPLGAGHPRRS